MIVKIKETENYKWIYQDEYDQWFDNRASVLNANIHHFINEKKSDRTIRYMTNFTINGYSMECFFLHENYTYNNYRRKKYNYTFITSGLLFVNDDYRGTSDNLHLHKLIAIQVLDKKTGSIKILVNQEDVNHSLIKELKTQMNMREFNSRKDIIKLETLSEFIDIRPDIDDSMPFDKVQEDYCIEKAEEALALLKQSISQLEQEEISPVDNDEDNSPL